MAWTHGRRVTFAPDFPVKAGRVGTLVPPERQGPKRTPPKLPAHDPLRYNLIPSRRGIVMQEVREMVILFAEPADWGIYRPTLFKLLKRAVFNEICHIEGFDPDISLHARGLADEITRAMLVCGTPEFVVAGAISVQRVVMQCHDRIQEGIYLGGDIFRGIDELADDLLRIKKKFCKENIEDNCLLGGLPRLGPLFPPAGRKSACTIDGQMNDCIHHNFVLGNHRRPYTTDNYAAGCGPTGHDKLSMNSSKCPPSFENINIEKDSTEEGVCSCTLLSSSPVWSAAAHGYCGCRNVGHIAGNLSSGYAATHFPNEGVLRGFSQLSVHQSTEHSTILEGNQYSIGTLSLSEKEHGPGSDPLQQSAQNLSLSGCEESGSLFNERSYIEAKQPAQVLYGLVPVHSYICQPGQLPQLVVTGWQWAPVHSA